MARVISFHHLIARSIRISIFVVVWFTAVPALFVPHRIQAEASTILVNTNSDTSTCTVQISLRCAIATANANITSPTIIRFNFSDTITVASVLTLKNTSQPITIDGSGYSVVIDGGDKTQIFDIAGTVTINKLAISNGHASSGGGIRNIGTLAISNCELSGNSANGYGGGVDNDRSGVLTIANSLFFRNIAKDAAGAVSNGGTLTIDNSTLSDNYAGLRGGGIVNDNGALPMTINGSKFSNNFAYNGGAIANYNSTITLYDSFFNGNSAFEGGVIYNFQGSVRATNVTLVFNEAIYGGGGITNFQTSAVRDSFTFTNGIIDNNHAQSRGGGIYNYYSKLEVSSSTLFNNSAQEGGGAFNSEGGSLTISNSTVSNNTAQMSNGGGVYNEAVGVEYDGLGGKLTISNSTVSNNAAPNGNGGGVYNANEFNILSTIIVHNTASQNSNGADIYEFTPLKSRGYNLIGKNKSGVQGFTKTDRIGVNLNLGNITNVSDYGRIYVLLAGNPAIKHGNCSGNALIDPPAPAINTDQRGFIRKTSCDVGAYETASKTQ